MHLTLSACSVGPATTASYAAKAFFSGSFVSSDTQVLCPVAAVVLPQQRKAELLPWRYSGSIATKAAECRLHGSSRTCDAVRQARAHAHEGSCGV